jgi:5-methylcytosine-specific restriction protein A
MTVMTTKQLYLLGANAGAFSIVTDREGTGDRSVTLDQYEKSVLEKKYSLDRFKRRGGISDDGLNERSPFYVLGQPNMLNVGILEIPVVYPKRQGNELRLYMQTVNGFYGAPSDYFVIFTRNLDPFPTVGFIPSNQWDDYWENLTKIAEQHVLVDNQDPDDIVYQKEVLLAQAGVPFEQTRFVLPRDPKVARDSIANSNYRCEFNREHQSFQSPVTGEQYMEAHHLIPLSQQNCTQVSLDIIENVVSLCPNCHKKIHLGLAPDKREMLKTLYKQRPEIVKNYGINLEQLYSFYNADV